MGVAYGEAGVVSAASLRQLLVGQVPLGKKAAFRGHFRVRVSLFLGLRFPHGNNYVCGGAEGGGNVTPK